MSGNAQVDKYNRQLISLSLLRRGRKPLGCGSRGSVAYHFLDPESLIVLYLISHTFLHV
jgi:hypothetical protein